MDSDSSTSQTANGTSRRVTSQQNTASTTPAPAQTPSQQAGKGVTVSVRGQEDVFIGDDYAGSPTRTQAATTPASRPSTSTGTRTASTTPAPAAPAQTPAASQAGGSKTARIRYQVPPIARPMDLRIELTDPSGKRDVFNRQVRSGESINTTARYTQECVISIYLGGEFVWQERQK